MPDGVTHYRFYKRGYFVEVPLSLIVCLFDWRFGLGQLVGYSFHRWCDNDLDLMGVNAAEGRMINELPIVGTVMFGFSSIYGGFFRRFHRSWITHFPGISTIIRLFFLFIVPFTILDAYGINFIGNNWHLFWIGFWSGLSHADAIHWYLDLRDPD